MRTRWTSLFVGLCLVANTGWRARMAEADEVGYPPLAPVLKITLPKDWTISEPDGPSQFLLCSPPDDPTYIISVMSLPTVGDKADLKEMLTKITRAGAQGSGMTDITVSNAIETTVGRGPRMFTRLAASGKHDGEASAYAYYAFTMPGTGRFYAVGVAGLQAMIDAHREDFEAVVASITPVR